MNRRLFLKLAALVGATAGFAKEVFALPDPVSKPMIFTGETDSQLKDYPPQFHRTPRPPIFKITPIDDTIGLEGLPQAFEPNDDGYLCFKERFCTHTQRHADRYAIYAPMHGFERTGPWYLVRTISRRDARRTRFTIVTPEYASSDLIPKMVPGVVDLPQPVPGQTFWRIHGPTYIERNEHFVSGYFSRISPATILIDVPEARGSE